MKAPTTRGATVRKITTRRMAKASGSCVVGKLCARTTNTCRFAASSSRPNLSALPARQSRRPDHARHALAWSRPAGRVQDRSIGLAEMIPTIAIRHAVCSVSIRRVAGAATVEFEAARHRLARARPASDDGPAQLDVGQTIINPDQWDGYAPARDRLLTHLVTANINNNVVLTGDIHSSWCADFTRIRGTPRCTMPPQAAAYSAWNSPRQRSHRPALRETCRQALNDRRPIAQSHRISSTSTLSIAATACSSHAAARARRDLLRRDCRQARCGPATRGGVCKREWE